MLWSLMADGKTADEGKRKTCLPQSDEHDYY